MAGGGTGATTMVLAEQLNHTESEIVYLDFSSSSMNVAQSRARFRGLKNVVWVREGIENIHRLNLATFDFMQCSGVLHHLKRPITGLKVLKDILQLEGGIDLMVYGTYGRTGVYHMQETLRLLNFQTTQITDELKMAKSALESLPKTNWFKKGETSMDGHKMGDSGIYDLLLHKRDISYTVPQFFQWIEMAGLSTVRYTISDVPPISSENEILTAYGIKHYDRIFSRNIKAIQTQMQKVSELIYSYVSMQNAFVSLNTDNEAQISNLENVLFIPGDGKCPSGLQKRVWSIKNGDNYFVSNVTEFSKGTTFPIRWPLNDVSKQLLHILVRSECNIKIATLFSTFRKQTKNKETDNSLLEYLEPLYRYGNNAGIFLLKKNNVKNFPKSNTPLFEIPKNHRKS